MTIYSAWAFTTCICAEIATVNQSACVQCILNELILKFFCARWEEIWRNHIGAFGKKRLTIDGALECCSPLIFRAIPFDLSDAKSNGKTLFEARPLQRVQWLITHSSGPPTFWVLNFQGTLPHLPVTRAVVHCAIFGALNCNLTSFNAQGSFYKVSCLIFLESQQG